MAEMTPKSSGITACCDPLQGLQLPDKKKSKFVGNDADLAREMNELSVEEREQIFEDVHGVAEIQEETPEFIEKCLEAFDKALAELPIRQKKQLNRAFFLRPTLETDSDFKLRFLRADYYDAKKAVQRMTRHFDLKRVLFGEEKLPKTIALSDLTPTDIQVFKMGYVMVLPQEDQTGRPVFFCDTTKLDFDRMPVESCLRCYWYILNTVVDVESAQKKGVCGIVYNAGSGLSMSAFMGPAITLATRGSYLDGCVPVRYSSFHFCYDNRKMEFLINALRAASSQMKRLRFRAHIGSELENEYELMSFGIRDQAVLRRAQLGDTSIQEQYLAKRSKLDKIREAEEQQAEIESNLVSYPKSNDVLIGRGHPYRDFSGNMLWNKLVCEHLDQYLESNHRFEKFRVSMTVVNKIHNINGRILQRTENGWRILEEDNAREKAAIAFRTRAKALAASNNNTKKPLSAMKDTNDDGDKHNTKRVRYDPSAQIQAVAAVSNDS